MADPGLDELRQDWEVRIGAIRWILELCDREPGEGVLNRNLYSNHRYHWQSQPVLLQHPQMGVTRPRQCQFPISIATSPGGGDYDDHFTDKDGVFRYSYQGRRDDSASRLTRTDNTFNNGLRRLMRLRWPLIYFHGMSKGNYLAVAPVMIVDDDPISQTFGVIWGEQPEFYQGLGFPGERVAPVAGDYGLVMGIPNLRRDEVERRSVKAHLAQGSFRAKILRAYKNSCALSRLSRPPLLDAVHIAPVSEDEKASYSVPNGLALSKLHHAAYDQNYLGITPDFKIKVRADLLEATDGPIFQHGIQSLHNEEILLPSRKQDLPDRDALARRYEAFERGQNAL
ncbi:MAG: HNH endonuclease [Gammaproteobacteria bacterium AqS3]|nr:HNH endonuclease [Gammaproteobacteria bacterium AqS3]